MNGGNPSPLIHQLQRIWRSKLPHQQIIRVRLQMHTRRYLERIGNCCIRESTIPTRTLALLLLLLLLLLPQHLLMLVARLHLLHRQQPNCLQNSLQSGKPQKHQNPDSRNLASNLSRLLFLKTSNFQPVACKLLTIWKSPKNTKTLIPGIRLNQTLFSSSPSLSQNIQLSTAHIFPLNIHQQKNNNNNNNKIPTNKFQTVHAPTSQISHHYNHFFYKLQD
jgi:hypothetical protein